MTQYILDHKEETLLALEALHNSKESDIPEILTEYMQFVAQTGRILFQWTLVRGFLEEKLKRVLTELNSATAYLVPQNSNFNYKETSSETLNQLNQMENTPFTIQRLCELLLDPTRHCNRIDKYLCSIRKLVFIGTTRNFYTPSDLSAISAKEDQQQLVEDVPMPLDRHPGIDGEMDFDVATKAVVTAEPPEIDAPAAVKESEKKIEATTSAEELQVPLH